MKWTTLISEDGGKSASMSRVGAWLSTFVVLVATILSFIYIIDSETYKNIGESWKSIILIFVGYQGVSKVSKHLTNKKEDKDNVG